jgi:hypothetical protein
LAACSLGACGTAAQFGAAAGNPRLTGGRLSVRWLGGGVVELATRYYKQIAYGDAWVWSNAGWSRFSVPKPPEYATKEGFSRCVASEPEAVFVLLTHDPWRSRRPSSCPTAARVSISVPAVHSNLDQPNVAVLCVGGWPDTMGPEEGALTCQWLGVWHGIPVHYAHTNNPSIRVTVMKPGDTQMIAV